MSFLSTSFWFSWIISILIHGAVAFCFFPFFQSSDVFYKKPFFKEQGSLIAIEFEDSKSNNFSEYSGTSTAFPNLKNESKNRVKKEDKFVKQKIKKSSLSFYNKKTLDQKKKSAISNFSYSLFPLVTNPQPSYPQEARAKNLETTVHLRLFVNQRGTVESITVLSSNNLTCFVNAAKKAAYLWRFKVEGKFPQKTVEIDVPLIFKLI